MQRAEVLLTHLHMLSSNLDKVLQHVPSWGGTFSDRATTNSTSYSLGVRDLNKWRQIHSLSVIGIHLVITGEEFASVIVRELREVPHTTVTSRSSRSRISVLASSTCVGFAGDSLAFARVVLPLIWLRLPLSRFYRSWIDRGWGRLIHRTIG